MVSGSNMITRGHLDAQVAALGYSDLGVARCFDVNMAAGASSLENAEFYPGDNVSVTGTGLAQNTAYKVRIQPDPVDEDDALNASVDPSGDLENVATDESGSFGPTELWNSIPAGSQMNYDIVVDNLDDRYNEASDGVDSASAVGIVAPIPELVTITLFAVGLVMLLGYLSLGRRD